MTYAELMTKIRKGEALTAEEVAEFEKLSRPADRFNEVSAAKQKAESELKEMQKKLEAIEAARVDEAQKLQDQVNEQLQVLSGKVEELTKSNNELTAERDMAYRKIRVNTIARDNPTGALFGDPEYLGYLLDRDKVDIQDAEKLKSAMEGYKEKYPEQFKTPVKGGSGVAGGEKMVETPSKPVDKWGDSDIAKFVAEGGTPEQYLAMRTKTGDTQ